MSAQYSESGCEYVLHAVLNHLDLVVIQEDEPSHAGAKEWTNLGPSYALPDADHPTQLVTVRVRQYPEPVPDCDQAGQLWGPASSPRQSERRTPRLWPDRDRSFKFLQEHSTPVLPTQLRQEFQVADDAEVLRKLELEVLLGRAEEEAAAPALPAPV